MHRILPFFDAVDVRDVGMIEGGEHLRFAPESGEPVGVGGQRRRQKLDSDVAPELRVERLIDLSHAACSEVTGDLVMREPGSDHRQADFTRCGRRSPLLPGEGFARPAHDDTGT